MTPRRLSDDTMSESSTMVKRSERNRMSGSTAVELDLSEDAGRLEKEKDADCDVVIESDAEEAKINRKIADLEISNASLLAINRSLEATKSKQRTEISKLRRALRDSLSGMPLSSTTIAALPLNTPLTPFSPSLDTDGSEYFDEEIVDPELEVKWDRISDLVGVMRRRGEEAVVKGRQEIKVGQRVLDWSEVQLGVQLEAGKEDEDEMAGRRLLGGGMKRPLRGFACYIRERTE
ncbi:MAG: hypothetical protein TREMPRED_004766 [Tremellales sp. Tagirdzhanova-0007]|nr:MAG: hypothetical protein TREMPRED_004766 [Tremellales sp. Tagirdzhanova-0007]